MLSGKDRQSSRGDLNVPTFLDSEEGDRSSLFYAWMYSGCGAAAGPRANELDQAHPARRSHRRTPAATGQANTLNVACSSGTVMRFVLLGYAHAYIWGTDPVGTVYDWACGDVATAAACVGSEVAQDPQPRLAEEPESGSIEEERVIVFRPAPTHGVRELVAANLRLSPGAIQFVTRARGRHLHVEENPEEQSE